MKTSLLAAVAFVLLTTFSASMLNAQAPGQGVGYPDLVVETFERTGPAKYKNGKLEVPFRIRVRNQGSIPAQGKIVNGIRLGKKYRWSGLMDTIPAYGTRIATGVIKVPDAGKLKKGRSLTFIAMADAPIAAADTSIPLWGRVAEASETNNVRILKVDVPGGMGLTSNQLPNQGQAPMTRPSSKIPKQKMPSPKWRSNRK